MPVQIQLRHDTGANWTAANPTLALGEVGVETDAVPPKFKAGDGATAWASLGYSGLADHGLITYLDATVAAAPGTPGSGQLRIYAKTGKVLAVKDDAGLETVLGAGGGGSTITVKDEGTNLTTSLTSMDFVGAGVVATNTGGAVTVTVSGGGGGGTPAESAAALITGYNLFR